MGKGPTLGEVGRDIKELKGSINSLNEKFDKFFMGKDGIPAQIAIHETEINSLKGTVAFHTQAMFGSLTFAVISLFGVAYGLLSRIWGGK